MARKGRRSSNEERLNAIRLLQQDYTKAEVANILDVAESSVYEWQRKFREGGLAALSTKIASGRKSLLTDEQLLKLYKWLRGNPGLLTWSQASGWSRGADLHLRCVVPSAHAWFVR